MICAAHDVSTVRARHECARVPAARGAEPASKSARKTPDIGTSGSFPGVRQPGVAAEALARRPARGGRASLLERTKAPARAAAHRRSGRAPSAEVRCNRHPPRRARSDLSCATRRMALGPIDRIRQPSGRSRWHRRHRPSPSSRRAAAAARAGREAPAVRRHGECPHASCGDASTSAAPQPHLSRTSAALKVRPVEFT